MIHKIIGVSAIALAMALGAPAIALADGHGHRPAATKTLIQKINTARANHGRGVLRDNLRARRAARHWNHAMIRFDVFEAELIEGHTNMNRFVWRFIPRPARVGTLAMYRCGPGPLTPQRVLRKFMSNPGTRRVVLMRGVRNIGIHWTVFHGGFAGSPGKCELLTGFFWGSTGPLPMGEETLVSSPSLFT